MRRAPWHLEVAASLATFCAYAGVVAWLTWPLAAHMGSHLPSVSPVAEMDTLHALWVLSWESHALAVAPAGFLDANIYHPAKDALLYSTMGLATLPYFAPVFLVSGNPVLAANLAFLLCTALAGWGMHRVTVWWTGSPLAGVVAAATFLATPWVLWSWTPARPIHVALLYFPWIVALVALAGWSWRRGLLLLVLVVLQCLVDPIYVAPAVVLPIVLIGLARVARPATRGAGLRLLATIACALLVLLPLYAGYAVMQAENPSLARQSVWAKPESPAAAAVPEGFVLAGGVWADLRPTGVPWIVLPLVALGLLSFAARPRPERAGTATPWLHAAVWVAVGVLLSTRSVIWLADPPVVVPSPVFMLVDRLAPGVASMLRGTVRLGTPALIGVALLAGLAFAECQRRLPSPSWMAVAAAVVVLITMYVRWPGQGRPYPIKPGPAVPASIIEALQRSSGPVLELPAGTGPFDTVRQARAMYRSIFHWRPLLNGYGSYWPVGFPERMALAARLPDPAAWEALRRESGVETVVVAPDAPNYAAWTTLAARPDAPLALVARDGGTLVFAAH